MQIQALIAEGAGVERGAIGSNIGPQMEVAKLLVFNGEAERVGGFVTACRLYLRMKMREAMVKKQVQWILSYIQGESADMWKENILEDLEASEVEYKSAGEFLAELKKEFGGEEESVKAAELRKLEQEGRMIEEFVHEFKRVARGSGYEGWPLVKEFKRGMNGTIRKKLMKAENQPGSIEQWFRRVTALDKNWKESRREEERLRGRKE